MARTLRWVALLALLAIPVIGYLGRRTTSDTCVGRVWGDCDIVYTSPGWAKPVEFVALGTAVLLLIIAAVVKRSPDDEGGSLSLPVLKALLYLLAASTLIAGIVWAVIMPPHIDYAEYGPPITLDDTALRVFLVILSLAFAALLAAIAWAIRAPRRQ